MKRPKGQRLLVYVGWNSEVLEFEQVRDRKALVDAGHPLPFFHEELQELEVDNVRVLPRHLRKDPALGPDLGELVESARHSQVQAVRLSLQALLDELLPNIFWDLVRKAESDLVLDDQVLDKIELLVGKRARDGLTKLRDQKTRVGHLVQILRSLC